MAHTCAVAVVFLFLWFSPSRIQGARVDGKWSAWSHWSGCAVGLCAGNQRIRTRTCTQPMPSGGGKICPGESAQQQDCKVDGGWSEWTTWSRCDKPCGGSVVTRRRRCDNPKPSPDGKPCPAGANVQTKTECVSPCPARPVDGHWSAWSTWSSCPKTCGVGGATVRRSRKCDNPPPMSGGRPCQGPDQQLVQACFTPCPVDGGFTFWGAWTKCSKTCGTGTRTRKRACTRPAPKHGGKNCSGIFSQTARCRLKSCPGVVNGSWSGWTAWTTCTEPKYCLRGMTHRRRMCDNPPPRNDGEDCQGVGEESRSCPTKAEGCEVYREAFPDQVPADPKSFVAQECGAEQMYFANGSYGAILPEELYRKFNFIEAQLRYAWFGIGRKDNLTTFCFQFNDAVEVLVLIENIADYYSRVTPLPNWEKPPNDTEVPNIAITLDSNRTLISYEFQLGQKGEYVPEAFFGLTDVRFSYFTKGAEAMFTAKGEYRAVPGIVFKTVVFFDGAAGAPFALGETDQVSFKQLLQTFGLPVEKLPTSIFNILDKIGLWDFTLTQVKLAYKIKRAYLLRVTSLTQMGGVPVHVEVLMGTRLARAMFAIGIVFDRFSIGTLAKKLTGLDTPFLDALGVDFKVGISYSPSQLPQTFLDKNVQFSKDPFKTLLPVSVPQDIYLAAMVGLPKNCGVSKFCEIAKRFLGPDIKLALTGNFRSKSMQIMASVYNIPFPFLYNKGVVFNRLDLYVKVDWNDTNRHVGMGFRCSIQLPVKGDILKDGIELPTENIYLGGELEFDMVTAQLEGTLSMKGLWRRAFGIPQFSLGNINLGINWLAGAPSPSGGLIGMRIEIGEDCLNPWDFDLNGHCFGGGGVVGIGSVSFLYADVTTLTLGKVGRMLNLRTRFPPPLEESGFPNGARVTFGSSSTDLRYFGGPKIKKGITLYGLATFMGYHADVDVTIGDNRMKASLTMDPILVGGYINVVRSPANRTEGPTVFLDLLKKPFYMKSFIEGYADVFGIEAYLLVNLTMGSLEVTFKGDVWNLVYADVFIEAAYVPFIRDAELQVNVDVDMNSLTDIINQVSRSVKSSFLSARAKFINAQKRVLAEKQNCQRKMEIKCDKCKSLKCKEAEDGCKGFMDEAGKWIGDQINAIGNFFKKVFKGWRRKRSSPSKFIPEPANGQFIPLKRSRSHFSRGLRRKRDLERALNQDFVVHLRRRRFVTKVICEGLVGGGCSAVSGLCQGSCSLVQHIAPGLCNLLDVAVSFLKGVERTCGWVVAAADYVATKLFALHSVKFQFKLDDSVWGVVPKSYTFTSAMDLTLFGRRLYQPFKFTLVNPLASILAGKDDAVKWYTDHTNPMATSEKSYYDKPTPYSDFDFSESFSIENQQSATEERPGACLYVENKVHNSAVKITGCKEGEPRQQFSYTLTGQIMSLHSQLCLDTNGARRGSRLIQSTCNSRRDDQNFQCDLGLRTMKRRRVDLCLTTGKTSLNGPGSLVQLSSLKCIHVYGGGLTTTDGSRLVIWNICTEKRIQFHLRNGTLVHTLSGKCVRPVGRATAGIQVGLYSSCAGHAFAFTPGGSLQHMASKMCLGAKSGSLAPPNGDFIVLSNKCENNDFSANRRALLFSFIPTSPFVRLEQCGDADNIRLDQRFEVAANPVASVCSKFSRNLALKKPTEQSSTRYGGFSERAVDGVYNEDYSFKSCTHTMEQANPWWRVDLGTEHIVTDVIILNRRKYADRLANFEVRVGAHKSPLLNPTCSERVLGVAAGGVLRLQCNPPVPGRYVSVYIFGKGILSLCEVSVYSRIGSMADLCQLENGGCQQVCINTCNLKVKCRCRPGYVLAYDGRTCLDINECSVNNGGCDLYNGKCVNTPGGHLCTCNQGYQLQENSKTVCEVVQGKWFSQAKMMIGSRMSRDCGVGNGGCEHICVEKSGGGAGCECRTGFSLAQDNLSCEDVNECEKDNGGCEHACHNYRGGHYCTCREGHALLTDGEGCEELLCPPLESPVNGHVTPSVCTGLREGIHRGTICSYTCPPGYSLTGGDHSRKCLVNGLWSGSAPECKPVVCPKLEKPPNGHVTPASCARDAVQYGTECAFTCEDGYELRGPRYTTCQNDTTWTDRAPVSCTKVPTEPWLVCPSDVELVLGDHQSKLPLGHHWHLPQTNMKNLSLTPAYLRDTYQFPAGKTRVTWTAVTDGGVVDSCFYHVTIKDVTPPTVSSCPDPISIKTDEDYVSVDWDEPVFTDNVGVTTLLASKRPGHQVQRDSILGVRYTATDVAGNSAECEFLVTVKSKSCPQIATPLHGDASYTESQLHIRCHQGFFLNPRPSGAADASSVTYDCFEGKWTTLGRDVIDPTLTSPPDCVEHFVPDELGGCPVGALPDETGFCLSCPPGSSHNMDSDKCELCNLGSYQDEEGRVECQPCSRGFSTKNFGAKSEEDCLPLCRPGYYSDNGFQESFSPCQPCPRGAYQSSEGQTTCLVCPDGSGTSTEGSTSVENCTVPAVITQTISAENVTMGTSPSLKCFVDGQPSPKITWTKVGGSLDPSRSQSTDFRHFDLNVIGSRLVIANVTSQDSGTYECHAVNRAGRDTKRLHLRVRPGSAPSEP